MFLHLLFWPVWAVSSLQKLEERFRISRKELISFEFTILVALEMALYLPESKVLPHYRRLVQQQQV